MKYETLLVNPPFTKKQRLDTALFTLKGLLNGIAIDGKIEEQEAIELRNWVREAHDVVNTHPFTEFIPLLQQALDKGLAKEDYEDILWVCQKFAPEGGYYDMVTTDIQTLHALLHGILADGKITEPELIGMQQWMESKSHLQGLFPYDELSTLISQVMKDRVIDKHEHAMLKNYFEQFFNYSMSTQIKRNEEGNLPEFVKLEGICAMQPTVVFQEKRYCFTGASRKATRDSISKIVTQLGGTFSTSVTKNLHYLVIGNEGNPAWAMACYGRKIEQAMNLRKEGAKIVMLHENDFWDTVLDLGIEL